KGGLPEIPALDRPVKIDLDAAKRLVDAGAAVFTDARDAEEYAAGHIPGARSLPYDQGAADPARLESLDTGGKPIAGYCGGGSCELSLNLAYDLVAAGQSRVAVFMGGFTEWSAAGYPVSRGATP